MNWWQWISLFFIGCWAEPEETYGYSSSSASQHHIKHMKSKFEKDFHQKCDKYPFVKRYVEMVEQNNEEGRFVTFVFNDINQVTGGMGDKLAGLTTAAAVALRFNRTLLIRSDNEVHRLFRPYHPTDINSASPLYTYQQKYAFTHFNPLHKNVKSERDMQCHNVHLLYCSLPDGDVPQQNIVYYTNRAFLAIYDSNTTILAHSQMQELGVTRTSDLFEVAGCLLRLALWPTDLLWREVEAYYHRNYERYFPPERHNVAHNSSARKGRDLRGGRLSFFGKKTRKKSAESVQVNPISARMTVIPQYQVGIHFRCGDVSFENSGQEKVVCSCNNDTCADMGYPAQIASCGLRQVVQYQQRTNTLPSNSQFCLFVLII